jgi:hypothetical protein
MSGPSDRLGFVLPGMPWFRQIQAEGRIIAQKWHVGGQAAKIRKPPAG